MPQPLILWRFDRAIGGRGTVDENRVNKDVGKELKE
jgi:hypothetical protein